MAQKYLAMNFDLHLPGRGLRRTFPRDDSSFLDHGVGQEFRGEARELVGLEIAFDEIDISGSNVGDRRPTTEGSKYSKNWG